MVSGPEDKGLSAQINVTRDCSVHPPWIQSTSAERFYFFFIFTLGKILSRSKKSWYYCPRTSKSQFRDFHARIGNKESATPTRQVPGNARQVIESREVIHEVIAEISFGNKSLDLNGCDLCCSRDARCGILIFQSRPRSNS